jgi:hypothetical protein
MPYVRWPEDSRGGENTPCTLSDGGATAPSQAADKRRGTLAGLLEPCSPANQACGLFLDAEFNSFGGALISIGLVCADGQDWYEVAEIPAEPHQGEQIGTPT